MRAWPDAAGLRAPRCRVSSRTPRTPTPTAFPGNDWSRSAPSAGASSAASSPSRAADPEAALRRLLATAPLAELVARTGAVTAEVSALDSDMQMLVYENYNKFIVATDTMRAMGGCLDGMDSKLQRLQTLLGGWVVHTRDSGGGVWGVGRHRPAWREERGGERTCPGDLRAARGPARRARPSD